MEDQNTFRFTTRLTNLTASVWRSLKFVLSALIPALVAVNCGGGSGSCGGLNTPCDFTIALDPPDAAIKASSSLTVTVNLTRASGFTDAVDVTIPTSGGVSADAIKITGNAGSLTIKSDTTATQGPRTVTVTGKSGSLTRTGALNLTVNPPPTNAITVSGKVLKFDGSALSGVNVKIVDGVGPKSLVVTGVDGGFTVTNVLPPYSVSALIPANTTYRPVTWDGVTRADPQIVMPGLGWFSPCTLNPATLTGSISPPIAAGSAGTFLFVGRGAALGAGFVFGVPAYWYSYGSAAAGDSSYSMSVYFDTGLCQTPITGTLVYLEQINGGAYTRAKVIANVTVQSGNTTNTNVASDVVNLINLNTTLNAPGGVQSANYFPALRVGGVTTHYPLAPRQTVNPGGSASFTVPSVPGLDYRIHIHGSSWISATLQDSSFWSDVVASSTSININMFNLTGPLSPLGTITGTVPFTPTFSYSPVTGANLYQVHIYTTDPYNPIWTGHTAGTSIQLPDLPTPSRLASGTTYKWSVDAFGLRGSPSIDDLLDGRMAKRNWDFSSSHYYAEEISGESFNYQSTTSFTTP